MIKLKVVTNGEIYNMIEYEGYCRTDDLYYIKSEADKVIAEKDSEIRRLENLCESYRIDCDNIAIREANTYKEIERDNKQLSHNKYKRCLAMAMWCKSKSEIYNEFAADASEYMPSYEARFRSKAALY